MFQASSGIWSFALRRAQVKPGVPKTSQAVRGREDALVCWATGDSGCPWSAGDGLMSLPLSSGRRSIRAAAALPPTVQAVAPGLSLLGSYKQPGEYSTCWSTGLEDWNVQNWHGVRTEIFINLFLLKSLLTIPKDRGCCCFCSCTVVVWHLHEAHMLNRLTCFGWPILHKAGIEFLQLHVEINLHVAMVSCKEGVSKQSKQPTVLCYFRPFALFPWLNIY